MKDKLGRYYKPGDTVVYPGRWGSDMWMNIATITGVHDGFLSVERDNYTNTIVRKLENVIIVERKGELCKKEERCQTSS